MTVISTEAFAIGGEPGADDLIFGTGEEYVAVFGVSVGQESEESEKRERLRLWGRGSLDLSQGPFLRFPFISMRRFFESSRGNVHGLVVILVSWLG